MNLDLKYLMLVFLRRIHYFIFVFVIVTAAAVTLAFTLPPVFQSEARLLLEGPKIPVEMGSIEGSADLETLQKIESRLLTRANYIDIANKFRVFEGMSQMSPDQIVEAMAANTAVLKQAGRDQAPQMQISFEARGPNIAAQVVNEYVTLIMADSAAQGREVAGQTTEFFENQVKQIGSELDKLSARIIDYKNENSDALPDTLDYRLSQQSLLQERIAASEREIASLTDQRARLVQIFNATGRIEGFTTDLRTPAEVKLDELRDQLASSLAIFSDDNPKIKVLKSQIAQLETVVRAQTPVDPSLISETSSPLEFELANIDTRIETIREQSAKTSDALGELRETIGRTPAISITLDGLQRDYDNTQVQYNRAVQNLANAAAAERIEVLAKGQRMIVLDAATAADRPTKPNRILIAVGGVFGGIFLGIGLIVLLELLNRSVRRPLDLVGKLGITPIATLPYIRSPAEQFRRRFVVSALVLCTAVGLPAIIYAIHTYYLPLDLILDKVAGKFGVTL